jgi:hypothetical protein
MSRMRLRSSCAGGLRLRIGELGPAFGDFLGPRPVEQLAQVLLLLVELGLGLLCLQLQSHGVEFGKHGSRVDLIAFLGVHADDPAIAVESQRDLTKIDIAVEDDFPFARLSVTAPAQRCSQKAQTTDGKLSHSVNPDAPELAVACLD